MNPWSLRIYFMCTWWIWLYSLFRAVFHNLECNKHASRIASDVIRFFFYTLDKFWVSLSPSKPPHIWIHLRAAQLHKHFCVCVFFLKSWMSVICAQLFSIESVWFRLIFSNQQCFSTCTFSFIKLSKLNLSPQQQQTQLKSRFIAFSGYL